MSEYLKQKQNKAHKKLFSFLEKECKEIYDWSNFKYIKSSIKSEIRCLIHNKIFLINPNHIYRKSGCSICHTDKISKKKTFSQSDVVKVLDAKYKNKFDFSKFEYIGISNKAKVKKWYFRIW